MSWIIAGLALIFGIVQFILRKKGKKGERLGELEADEEFEEKKIKKATHTEEDRYRNTLENELGSIRLLGSPDIESISVKLDEAFVSLRISESWRSEKRFDLKAKSPEMSEERYSTPEKVIKRAFEKDRMLLIIGDPGSGKTTLLKYYAMCCLYKQHEKLGFKDVILPIYLPLREVEFPDGEPELLPESLARWAKKHVLDISVQEFTKWLHNRDTLILCDGLDEVSDLKERKKICEWIKNTCNGLTKARFVVTSRWTGYRKLDGIELEVDHHRADVMDFTPKQQEEFLKRWFRAIYANELLEEGAKTLEWEDQQKKIADQKAQSIIDFITREDNKSMRELASVPMLLQIMAIIFKERQFLARSRFELYDKALNYLLEFRDRRRKLDPVLSTDKARRVLSPTALWMQEKLKSDEAAKAAMHKKMQPTLNTMDEKPNAVMFCSNLRDRAGLICDYGKTDYIFRHKSFREFLSGLQILKESKSEKRLQTFINHFNNDWWEESIRFFMSEADDELFDKFMRLFFKSDISRNLDNNKQNLLQIIVRETPQKRVDALIEHLNSGLLNLNQKRYVLDCLKIIEKPEAKKAVEQYSKSEKVDATVHYAKDIVAEATAQAKPTRFRPTENLFIQLPKSFRNPFEDNLEYILIPGGSYQYSGSKKVEPVPNIYFAKYQVTNKRYRKFISFLSRKEKELESQLNFGLFSKALLKFAGNIKGYVNYLGADLIAWPEKLGSVYNDDKRFNESDQPVVGITWFAARAYCFWLSCLHAMQEGNEQLEGVNRIASIYRLPTEVEWEWAAAGREKGGSLRKYPWPKEKGEPNKNLANYNQNVGKTTPVGRYPEGATPEGLMDMAGNVWEWMENLYDKDEDARALRGGSWDDVDNYLRCSARNYGYPVNYWNYYGFRVVLSES